MDGREHIKKAQPRPVLWEVQCPMCSHGVEATMNENDDGQTFESGDFLGDPFVTCDVCNTVIEPTPVVVSDAK